MPWKEPRSNAPLLEELIHSPGESKFQSSKVPSLQATIIVDNSAGRVDTSPFRSIISFEDVLQGHKGASGGHGLPKLDPNDIVNIQFTSGTTSMPKAASLSHRSILNNGKSIGDRMLLTEQDVVCCPPPLFHCFGCILGYMATATHGSAIVFPSEAFNPLAALKSVQEEKCTGMLHRSRLRYHNSDKFSALYGVPTMFTAELELLGNETVAREGFEHLRTGIAAGSSVPAELMRKLHRELNLTELTICYGMTETSPVSAMTTTDDPIEKRINTVGRLLPHVEAKVVDPQDWTKILPIGTRGELAVSGYLVMKKYWGDEKKTAEVLVADSDGKAWMHVSQCRTSPLAR